MEKPRVLVIGDLMIDEWVYGGVERLSPEAPIPIVDVRATEVTLGGAGNVLVNLHAIGAHPMVISGVSETKDGHTIKKLVKTITNDAGYFNIPASFRKQRICGANQQIVRIDYGKGAEISDIEIYEYLERLEGKVDVVLVADYGKGAVTDYVLLALSDFCYREKIKLLIDPYMREYYKSSEFYCHLIKLNRNEAENFSGVKITDEQTIRNAGLKLMGMFDTDSIIITLGQAGMAYFDKNEHSHEPYRRIDNPLHVYDVCGAGDVVFAVLGYMVAGDRHYEDMLEMAIKAGKLAVSKKGTSVITKDELWGI